MKKIADKEQYVRESLNRIIETKETLMRAKGLHEEALYKFSQLLQELRDLGVSAAGAEVYWIEAEKIDAELLRVNRER